MRTLIRRKFAWLLFLFVVGWLTMLLLEEGDAGALLWMLPFVAYSSVGALVVSRRPENRLGWIYLLSIVFLALTSVFERLVAHGASPPVRALLVYVLSVGWIGGLGMMITVAWLFFPDGRLPSARWRPLFWLAIISLFLIALEDATGESPLLAATIPAGVTQGLSNLGTAGMLVATFGAALSLVIRYRRANSVVRQQIKWIVASVLVASPLALMVILLGERQPEGSPLTVLLDALLPLVISVVPISAGLAIFKYRLYDIDFVIRKTLGYTLLTGFLLIIYFGSVVGFQQLFRAVTGQESQVAMVFSTLAVAVLFAPLRRRIQDFIDRRFYRQRYNAQRTVERFARTARDAVELELVTAALLIAVEETLKPDSVAIWLKPALRNRVTEPTALG